MMTSRKTIQTLRDRNQSKKLRSRDRSRKLLLEQLEDRRLLATIINVPADQGTIQAAINAANNGDTVLVADGTYVGNLQINKADLTLQSANEHGAVIQTQAGFDAGKGYGGVTVLADGVTIDGFKIEQGVAQAVIHTHDSDNVTISDNWIIGTGGAAPRGIDVGYASANSANVTISGNTFEDLYCGVYINQATNLKIDDNSFSDMDQTWGGAVVVDGTWPINGVDVLNNDATNAGYLIYFYGDADDVQVENNTLDANTVLSDFGVYNSTQGEFFQTIQAAIDAAVAGDTINVAAGAYTEDVLVAKAVTIVGPNAGIAAGVGAGTRGAEAVLTGGFRLSASNVVIDGLTIENGVGPTGIGDITAVYMFSGTTGNIIRNNILDGPGIGPPSSRGILSTYDGHNNVTIQNNEIFDWTAGIHNQGNDSVNVFGNYIHDNFAGVANDLVKNVTIEGNRFEDNQEAVGFYSTVTDGTSDVTVTDNDLADNTSTVVNYGGDPIDASPNWWGTTDADAIRTSFGTNNVGVVSFSPFLLSGTDTSGAPGFQGDLTELGIAGPSADGSADTFRIVKNDTNVEVYFNEVLQTTQPLTTSLEIAGSTDDDTLIIDFSAGNPIPDGDVSFEGGTGGHDTLSVVGNQLVNATLTHTSSSSGTIVMDDKTVTYTGLEPISVNTPGANWILENSTVAAPVILAASGADLKVSRSGAAEDVTINPAGLSTLTVRTGTGVDTVELQSLPAGWSANITIDGQGDSDSVTIDGTTADDALVLTGNTISNGTATTTLSNVESLTIDVSQDATTKDTVTVNQPFTGASASLLVQGGGAGTDELTVNAPSGAAQTIDVDGDSVAVTGQVTVDYTSVDALYVNAIDEKDTVNVNPTTGTTLYLNAGDPAGDPGDVLNFSVPVGQTATIYTDRIETTGDYQPVYYAQFENVNLAGNVTVGGTGQDDVLELTADSANSGSYVLTSNSIAGPTIGLSAVTKFTFNSGGGDDQFILNHPAATLFAPSGGIFYNGGEQTTATGDSLTINGASLSLTSITHRFDLPGADGNNGWIQEVLGATTNTITYTGLEPVTHNAPAAAVYFTFTGGAETVTLSDDATPNDTVSRIVSTLGEVTTFNNPSTSLTINLTNDVDTLDVQGLDSLEPGPVALSINLTINGDGGDTVNFTTGTTNIGAGNAHIGTTGGQPIQTINFGDGSNLGALQTSGDVSLTAVGGITTGGTAVDVSANMLTASAGTGIDLDTTVATITAGVSGPGAVGIDETDGVTLTSVTTNNGSITVNAGGTIVATYVASLTDADANDISLTASGAASNINVTTINAGAAGDVTLSAGNDVLDTNSTDANLITADVLTVDAANGTDDTTDGIVLDTTVASLDASVTAGGAGGNINIDETDAIILTDVDTTNGSITVDAGGQITATDVQSAMDAEANDIILSNTSGDIVVGLVSAAGSGDVYLNAAAGIEEDGTADGDADIVGQDIELVATAGIGDDAQLEIDGTNLAATTSTGDIDLLDTAGGLTIADVNVDGAGTSGVTITGGAGGWYIRVVAFSPLTVNSPVSDNAGGNITLAANGTAVTDDVDLNADVTATGGNGDISIYAGDSIDVDGVVTISAAGTGDLLLSASTSYNGGTPANGYNGAVGEAATAGLVLMQDGSVVQSQDGDITLRGDGDVLLSTVNANAAGGTTTVGNVTVAADFDGVGTGMSDGAGEITDNLAGETANVTGYLATLTAASGIGSADDLETNIRNFVARNTTTGDVSVNEVAAGGVLYVLEVTQAGADPSLIVLTTERGSLVLPSPGGLGVSITNSANTSGTILLDANVTQPAIDEASRGDVLVNQVVTSQGGAITINADHDVTGQGDITSNGGAINITADANGNGPGGNNNGTIQLSGDIAAGTGTVTFSLSDCDGEIVGDVDAGNVIMGRDDMVPEGALRLNGTTTVETLTRVDRGALLINGTMTVPDVTVTDNGLLGGNGTITGDIVVQGATSPDVGGILDPGDLNPADCSDPQAGQLTVNGDVDVESGGTFRVQLGGLTPGVGGYDQLVLNGSGNLYGTVLDGAGGGALEVQIVSGYSVPVGGEYIIISNDLTDLIGTRFLGLPEGAFLSPDGVLMNISYLSGTDNNDVTLTAPGRYDFNGFGGHTETNYMPMSPFQEKTGNTAGWEGTLPWYFERFSASDPGWDQLRYDGQSTDPMGNPLTFAVDVVPGKAYEVMILTGDASWNHDLQQFQVYDGNGAVPPDYPLLNALPTGDTQLVDVWGAGAPDGSGVQVTWGGGAANPSAGYYRWVRFTTDDISVGVSGLGSLLMKMLDRGGSSGTTVILAMDIRPVDAVGELTLTGTPFSVLPADGMTVDTYTGTGAPPNAVLTVTVSAGSPLQYATVTPDAVPAADAGIPSAVNAYAPTFGGQVKSDADGNFTFSVTRPATLTVNAASEDWTIVVEESSGLSRGTAIQPYEAPSQAAPLRFDFGATTSPVQTDFLQVVPQTIYNATRGYGWATRVAAGDRRDNYDTYPESATHNTASALRTDFNSGRNATFKVDLPNDDGVYSVRLYHSNPLYFGRVPYTTQPFTVIVEGVTYDVPVIAPGTTYIQELTDVSVSDGRLDILFGGNSTAFTIAGLDISGGTLPTDTPLVAAGDPLDAGAAAIGVDQLQPVAAEAAAWWTATGLTPAQAASLAGVQYAVADLGGAYLGLANPATNTIRIDDDAAMFGWSLVTGHSSLVTGHWSLDDAQMTNDKEPMTHDGVSLLTVVRHELGHLLGYEHSDDPDDLMAPVLSASPARAASSPFALDPSALTLPPSGTSDAVFADWGQDDLLEEEGDEAGQLQRLPSQSPDLLAAVLVQSGEDAEEAAVPRRSRLQRYERDLDAWFTELAAESQEGEG